MARLVKPDCGSERPERLPCREKIHKHFLKKLQAVAPNIVGVQASACALHGTS
jgi:hypothetical protein